MNNNKGQSLVDVIFSIGIVVLVLTGVVVLVVNTTRVKRMAFERQKAVELSQLLIEDKVLEIKNNTSFWTTANSLTNDLDNANLKFPNYIYDIQYKNCTNQSCNIVFIIKWEGVGQSLSVERFFSRQGI